MKKELKGMMEKLTILTEIFWNILRNNKILIDLSEKNQ